MTAPGSDRPGVILGDGNGFAVLGECRRAARRAGWTDERIAAFSAEATAGGYETLFGVVVEHFDVEAARDDPPGYPRLRRVVIFEFPVEDARE